MHSIFFLKSDAFSFLDIVALDAAMVISGGLDMHQQLNFRRSMRCGSPF